jgi:hypothetical protein
MRSIGTRHDRATPRRYPPTDERLPLWQAALIWVALDALGWAVLISIGWLIYRAL